MSETTCVYATGGLIVAYFLACVIGRKFDPFAPTWLFLVGYVQVYVVQALSYHDWAVLIRGQDLVAAANFRALWALAWFLVVYHLSPGRAVAGVLPTPPRGWSSGAVGALAPVLAFWGLFCAGMVIRFYQGDAAMSAEVSLLGSFPFVMMVAAIMLIVTGRSREIDRPIFLPMGLFVAAMYVAIWMFNGKRSHSLIGVLATVCAFYITRLRRPSWPVLLATAFSGAMVVTLAIGWRDNRDYEFSAAGFTQYASEFKFSKILENINIESEDDLQGYRSQETTEYGGFLLMMDTVPEKSAYDYGENYLRVFSTFIPRILWPNKPIFGRARWVGAWMAGSEFDRADDFTGPAIGLLGATQLNGGAVATAIVVAMIAVVLRAAYEYFRRYADAPWVQLWWSITFFNAWFMVVNDDPLIWFYYNWGFSGLPLVVLMWWISRAAGARAEREGFSGVIHGAAPGPA